MKIEELTCYVVVEVFLHMLKIDSIYLPAIVDVTKSKKLPYHPGIAVNGQDLASSYWKHREAVISKSESISSSLSTRGGDEEE